MLTSLCPVTWTHIDIRSRWCRVHRGLAQISRVNRSPLLRFKTLTASSICNNAMSLVFSAVPAFYREVLHATILIVPLSLSL